MIVHVSNPLIYALDEPPCKSLHFQGLGAIGRHIMYLYCTYNIMFILFLVLVRVNVRVN